MLMAFAKIIKICLCLSKLQLTKVGAIFQTQCDRLYNVDIKY